MKISHKAHVVVIEVFYLSSMVSICLMVQDGRIKNPEKIRTVQAQKEELNGKK